jgi:hypothetical protein
MVFPRINDPKTTTADTFAGDALNKIQEWLAGINIASADVTNKPVIDTDTRFKSGRLRLFDSSSANELSFVVPTLTTPAAITFPATLSNASTNELLFAGVSQAITNKTINAAANSITNIADANIMTGAAIAWAKISKAGSGLGDIANVDLTGLANNYSIRWDASVSKWVVYSVATAIGESNTASNVGTAGVGIYKQKTLVDLQFKKINSGSSSVTVTDDPTNSKVDIDVVDATTTLKGKVRLAPSGDTTTGTVVQATDARLTDARPPSTHATSHKNGQADVIKINEFGAGTANVTTTTTTVSANGTAPMLPNNSQLFLNGVGNWSEPVGTGSGVSGTGSILRGTTTKTGNGSTKVFTIAHGMGITPTSYFVHGNSVDALGAFTLSADSTNITVTYTVAPPTGTNNLAFTWVVLDSGTGSTVGEVNTYSSVGSGISIIKTKVGVDFPFKSLFAGSTRISITGNTNDVSLDVNQANLAIDYSQLTNAPTSLVKMNQANVYGDFLQTLRSSRLKIMNPLNTVGYLIAGSAITTTDRTLTLPLLAADDTFAVLALAQTLTNKTLTNPIIDTIKSGSFNFTVPSITANDTIVGRNTTDTLTNKTLTNPTISTINNGVGVTITLPTNTTTVMGTSDTATVTNKTAVLSSNTLTDTGAVLGGIPIHNGTRYVNIPQGPQGTFLGVCGAGTLGYFTPDTGSGGTMPDGSAIPNSGRWGALWGGTTSGRGLYSLTNTVTGTTTYGVLSPTESSTIIATAASDDSIAEMKTTEIFTRQANLVFRAKWSLLAATNATIMIGFSGGSVLPTGGSHDTPLQTASGIMITCSLDIESVYQISRNDGTSPQTKVATTAAANNTSMHTCEINLNTTNATVILDGVTYGPYTTKIPSLGTKMTLFHHIEAIGGTAKSLQLVRSQLTCL